MGDDIVAFIPVNEPLINGNEKKYLCECIDTGWISSEGPFVKEFEQKMSMLVGRKYGIAVSSGTAALEVAVQALGIGEGDEVIMPAFTIISCAMAVTKVGAVPVLVDSDLTSWNMDVDEIEAKITSKTKAIMMVHLYGLPVEVSKVTELAERYNLKIIEDAAEMHGQTYNGRKCGSFGDISTFSFYSNKHITTGEGGMVVTDDIELAERSRMLRNLCFRKDVRYMHDEISDNYRFTNLQAAVGLAQLERLNEFIEKKRQMGRYYTDRLKGISGLILPIEETEYADNIYWVYGMVLDKDIPIDNRTVQKLLAEEGIGSRTFFWCIHEQPVYQNQGLFQKEKYPKAEYLARKGFYVPSGLALTEEKMEKVVSGVRKVMNKIYMLKENS
ncbi:DegT/DnrJ/EryC1/StrS family aminotransferase [Parablautia intestinalis]|uniref:DegT/DnrJ/EryC1/StrS family aminotransferase n=1 Tax=Parablautia intestinalis TaxID=2320100 RepID=UPI0024128D46|nr:DegT/DnrJ/EryC1/StrS family aminotransferase [Parablautia intestinalis]